jgi:hypothetical protein
MAANGISGLASAALAADPKWAAVNKVANSPRFARAPLLREFLLYIAEYELSGHSEEITEQKIGYRVYKRSEVYSPADDNIVRVSAHQLRVKLREFYESEGKDEPWIVEIPKGKYVPFFRKRSENIPDAHPHPSKKIHPGYWLAAAAALMIAAILLWPYAARNHSEPHLAAAPPNLITSIFSGSSLPVNVVMSDEALVLMQSMLGQRFTLEEYTNQTYRNVPTALKGNREAEHLWQVLANRQIVNVGDAGISTRIRDSLTELAPSPVVEIHSAQNMRPRDFLGGNFILLGESSSDPWVEMFGENRFNFQFSPDITHFPRPIFNIHPRAGEQKFYAADLAHNVSYARVAYIPNVTGTGHVLLIAGTSMEGTEAAAAFCLQPESVALLRRDLGLSDGKPLPAFEVLLFTSAKGGAGVSARIVSARTFSDVSP